MSIFDLMALQSPIDWALAYAKLGWAVFPVQPRVKAPLTAHGFKDASTAEAVNRGWWMRWPDANLGVATCP